MESGVKTSTNAESCIHHSSGCCRRDLKTPLQKFQAKIPGTGAGELKLPQSRQAALACTFGEVVLLDLGVSVDLVAEAVLGREGVCPDEAARRPVFS